MKIALINEEKLRYKQEYPSKLTKRNIWYWFIFVLSFYFILSKISLSLDVYTFFPFLFLLFTLLIIFSEIMEYFTRKMKIFSLIFFGMIFFNYLLSVGLI